MLLSFSVAVRFLDCGQGGLVHLVCSNPSDFRIEANGVVFAARSFQQSTLPMSPVMIKASDTTTKQQWVTQVMLTRSSQQVNTKHFYSITLQACLSVQGFFSYRKVK